MIAYTAWDSLQLMAREFGAELALQAEDRIRLTPVPERSVAMPALRLLCRRLFAGHNRTHAI